MDNFDLKKYLVENKVTTNSKMIKENQTVDRVDIGGKVYDVGSDDPDDEGIILSITKHSNGYFIMGGVYSEVEDYFYGEEPEEGYGYAIDLEGNPMSEDDLK